MKIKLGNNAYGKNAVNLSKITRHGDHNSFRQISVDISLTGDFESAHTEGDNTRILPTDTQKNTVYALAKDHFIAGIEEFALYLANYFLVNNPQVSQTDIRITEHAYQRISTDGNPHPHAFIAGGAEKHTAAIRQHKTGVTVTTGIEDLLIVKTAHSGFENYVHDQFTMLKETSDRILATQCEVSWIYRNDPPDYTMSYYNIRNTLLKTFADHHSLSVQHTMYWMGKAVLEKFTELGEISFIMPNKHHILFNLAQFEMENDNEIFVATDEPYGYITATVTRDE